MRSSKPSVTAPCARAGRADCAGGAADHPGRVRRELVQGLLALPLVGLSRVAAAAPAGAVQVASLAQLSEPWSAVEFVLPEKDGELPGIVIRLPANSSAPAAWYASSRICPHAKCVTLYMKDPQMASDTFDVKAVNPVLGCPCHFSVFDVAQAGKVISGPAPSPPELLQVRVEGTAVYVSR